MRISDWSSDVCSSDLQRQVHALHELWGRLFRPIIALEADRKGGSDEQFGRVRRMGQAISRRLDGIPTTDVAIRVIQPPGGPLRPKPASRTRAVCVGARADDRSDEHTSALQSLM